MKSCLNAPSSYLIISELVMLLLFALNSMKKGRCCIDDSIVISGVLMHFWMVCAFRYWHLHNLTCLYLRIGSGFLDFKKLENPYSLQIQSYATTCQCICAPWWSYEWAAIVVQLITTLIKVRSCDAGILTLLAD